MRPQIVRTIAAKTAPKRGFYHPVKPAKYGVLP